MPDMLYFDTEMRKPGVTRQLLWMEYKAQAGDNSMGYSHFCRCYRGFITLHGEYEYCGLNSSQK